jgi:plasmid maintenance system antidote protein VapI
MKQAAAAETLGRFLGSRGVTLDGAAVLAGVNASTISRIVNGRVRARPTTIVRLARALGVSARRMQAMCDESYGASELDEAMSR